MRVGDGGVTKLENSIRGRFTAEVDSRALAGRGDGALRLLKLVGN